MNAKTLEDRGAVAGQVDRPVGPTPTPPCGWFWVQFEPQDGERTAPQPARWDGRHWHGDGWNGLPWERAIVLEPCQPPGVDPLQGAANWLCQACDEPDVALLQRQLLIGYNRAARLFLAAMPRQVEA